MCGRFTLEKPIDAIQLRFGLSPDEPVPHVPRYNVSPGQHILTVVSDAGQRRPVYMRWGLIPSWQKEPKPGPINARAETVAERPMFRAAYRQRRCLIPADGFYEWKPLPAAGAAAQPAGPAALPGVIAGATPKRSAKPPPKQPFRFMRADGELFAFAGIWETWLGPSGPLLTCCLLTTTPNELVAPVHDRMPLILPEDAEEAWLRGEPVPPLPYPADEMIAYPVSTRVNSPRNDDAACIAPLRA